MGQYFKLHGLVGYLVAVVLLLSILAILTVSAISVQSAEATNFYKINQDTNALKMINADNKNHYHLDSK
jgi:hypothetical protein